MPILTEDSCPHDSAAGTRFASPLNDIHADAHRAQKRSRRARTRHHELMAQAYLGQCPLSSDRQCHRQSAPIHHKIPADYFGPDRRRNSGRTHRAERRGMESRLERLRLAPEKPGPPAEFEQEHRSVSYREWTSHGCHLCGPMRSSRAHTLRRAISARVELPVVRTSMIGVRAGRTGACASVLRVLGLDGAGRRAASISTQETS